MFEPFWGNAQVASTLQSMIEQEHITQTLLFAGPEGVGKATLARRFAAAILGDAGKIEHDDLSLAENIEIVESREKWTADKRNEDPLVFATHPDFLTFAPDGPLRQITIPQMRLLKERAPYKPHKGQWRVFLIDHVDRANEQAANSLLKTLEEPPDHLIIIMTAENSYDLLPTIRSRAVPLYFTPLAESEMAEFARLRGLKDAQRRVMLASGSPGVAISLDLEVFEKRRNAMMALLQVASGAAPFESWLKFSESIGRSKSDKLDYYLKVLYGLLRDMLLLREGGPAPLNRDIERQLQSMAEKVSFTWLRKAVSKTDEIALLLRRNIQKTIALDDLILDLRSTK